MEIRLYQPSDRQAVLELWTLVFGDDGDHNSPNRSLDRKLAHADDLLFVAQSSGHILGTVMGGYDGHRGWVYSLAVKPDHRREGIATALMQHLESQLEQLGCPKLNLQVRADNQVVLSFYQQLGYEIEERVSLGKRLPDGC